MSDPSHSDRAGGVARALADDPGLRIALVMSAVTCAWGATLPFLSRWLEAERGLSGAEIGAILSSAQLARIVIGPAIAAWADGARDRRWPIRLALIASTLAFAVFFAAQGFWALFATGFIASTLSQAIMPLVEGAALRAGESGRVPYGVSRAFASSAFIIGNVGGGLLISLHGVDVLIVWTMASLGLAALFSFTALKPDSWAGAAESGGFRMRVRSGLRLLRAPGFARLLVGVSLIQAAHAFYYGFSVLVWRNQDISATWVGLLWAFGVGVEVVFLALLPQIEKRVSPEAMIVAGGAVSILRWTVFAFAPVGWILWPLQALHALTFAATHVGALRLMFRTAPEAISGFTQTLYAALASGLLMGLATLASGFLYDRFGAGGYAAMAVMCAIGLALTLSARECAAAQLARNSASK